MSMDSFILFELYINKDMHVRIPLENNIMMILANSKSRNPASMGFLLGLVKSTISFQLMN